MPQIDPAPSPPSRSVRDLIAFWDERVAQESARAGAQTKTTAKARIDVFELVPRCRYCQQPRLVPVVTLAPSKSTQGDAQGRLAQAGKDEAKLRLSRLIEPLQWGRKGNRRGE